MPQFDTFSCWIQVDGVPLPEFRVEDTPDGEALSCWIPSEAGKTFQICYSDSERVLTTSSMVFVDGQSCGGKVIYSKYDEPYYPSAVAQDGVTASEISFRPFMFSQCHLIDDDLFLDRPTSIGQVVVGINEAHVHGLTNAQHVALEPLFIHERAKSGVVHGIKLGAEIMERHTAVMTSSVRRIATFIFNYRPLDVLLANGIAPLTWQTTRAAPKLWITMQGKAGDCGQNSRSHTGKQQTNRPESPIVKQENSDDLGNWTA